MNMAYILHQDQDSDYRTDCERGGKDKSGSRSRRPMYSRRSRPVVHNGIHRRRNKRLSW